MDPVTRRSFLLKGSVGTAVAAGAVAGGHALLTPDGGRAGSAEPALRADELARLDQPLVLNVRDAAAGQVEVLVGEREIVLTDRALVARLLRATA